MTETTKPIPTVPESIDRFVRLFTEIDTLGEDVKALSEELDESGLDVKTIKAAAKLIANQKYQDFREKTTKVLDLLETVGK